MKMTRLHFHILRIFCIFAAGFSLISCKGRTADNMEPTGDTIEVVISQAAEIQSEESLMNQDAEN